MALTDILPNTTLGIGTQPNGIHFHSAGNSAGAYNCSSDFPSIAPTAATGTKTVTTKINGTQGSQVRFSNPA